MVSIRSRDVAELRASMTFDPVKINLQQSQYQCEHGGRTTVCVTTELCFIYSIKSKEDLDASAGEPRNTPILIIKTIPPFIVLQAFK